MIFFTFPAYVSYSWAVKQDVIY